MDPAWRGWVVLSALTVAALGVLVWKKKKRIFVKVGHISKLYFYPVKSLKGIEVTEGKCTKYGFEVNGLLDRSFMLISDDKVMLSQRQAPTLALLTPQIIEGQLLISGPGIDSLTIDIKASQNPKNEVIQCQLFTDIVNVSDCGEKAAKWFQHYLQMPNIRLVHYFPDLPKRKYTKNHPFYIKFRKNTPISLQDLAPIHLLSQPSIDDLNQKATEKMSVKNFRPNILVDGCASYAEDCWKYIQFNNGVEMETVLPVTRCLLTTVIPEKGVMTQKEPLTTLRKYRIPKDPELLKKTGAIPCFGTACTVLRTGEIKINEEISAVVNQPLDMVLKD